MTEQYDLVVLGAGTAAVKAAKKCAKAGWSVAIVDEKPYGGTCPLRGCDPKKMLRRGAEIVDAARLMRGKGIVDNGLHIDWGALVAFKRSFTEAMPAKFEKSLARAGVATMHGRAQFVGERQVEVEGVGRIEGHRILVATGAMPRPLDQPGAGLLVDSEGFMELEALPPRILFVGGGYISFEFAHMAARAGSQVTIVNRGERVLSGFDADLVDRLVARGRDVGITVETGASVAAVERAGSGFAVQLERDGERMSREADLVVHGAGRVPAVEPLGPGTAGIETEGGGVKVTPGLRSVSNPHVWAAGDATKAGGPPLTPTASIEGSTAAENMLNDTDKPPDYSGIPSVVFTIPELATVGLSEDEAKERHPAARTVFNDTGDWFSNMRAGESCAATKVIVDDESGHILGAHLLGPESAELVNFFGLAIRLGLSTGDLEKMVAAYPTAGSDLSSML